MFMGNLSAKDLTSSKNGEFDESIHMKDLEKNLENGCSPADCLINKYKLNWDKSVMPIYEEMIF